MSRARYARLLFAALVVLALGGIYLAAGSGHVAAAAPAKAARSRSVPVAGALRVCPAPGSAGVTTASVALTAVPGSATSGAATISRLTPGGSGSSGQVVATVTKPGLLHISAVKTAAPLTKAQQVGDPGSSPGVTTKNARGGVLISATGAMAQGLEVEQTGPAGLVTAQCGAPGTSFWFVGPGQSSTANIDLYLMNTDSQPADAQVSMLTDVNKGAPLLGNADNGITVPPHSMIVQSLSTLLRSSKVIALNVSTSVGRVVAAVRESRSGKDDGSWLPPTGAPARTLVIPGLPRDSGPHDLFIAVPGEATAQVKLTAVTTRGSYQPTGGTGIALLGGSAVEIPLSSLSSVSGSLKVSANVPVTAALMIPGGPAGSPGALAASASPLFEQGVLADNPARSAGQTEVILSAPGKAATVRITEATVTAAASPPGTVVTIKAGASVLVRVGAPAGAKVSAFTVVVAPLSGSGPVYASRVSTVGRVVRSVLPVSSAPTAVQLLPVQESLSAFLR
ncbi:MAG: DUF5719 family protein [Streptosporangiaceae bacterium]